MEKHILSKSTYIKGEQCLKYLYLYKKRYFLRDRMPPERIATFTRGTRVGIMARQLFPDGIDCGAKAPSQYAKAVEKTKNAIEKGISPIYEACFLKHNTLIFLDILVKKKDGWHAYEVKSSIKLSDTYYKDAALQYYVIEKSELKLKSFNLVYINKNYTLSNEYDIQKAFLIENVTKEVSSLYKSTGEKINIQIETLKQPHSPDIKPGLQCRKPYDCDFISHCWKNIPEKSVFSLPSLTFEEKLDIFNSTKGDISEAYKYIKHNETAMRQLKAVEEEKLITDKENLITADNGSRKIFLKILTFAPALPVFTGTSPYESTAYAFGILIKDKENKTVLRDIFISINTHRPDSVIIEKLNSIIKPDDTILVYDSEPAGPVFNVKTINIYDFFSKGIIVSPDIKDYRFSTVYQAITEKKPWHKKVVIDRQAANIYEKAFRNNFDNASETEMITKYIEEQLNYIQKLYFSISKLKNK